LLTEFHHAAHAQVLCDVIYFVYSCVNIKTNANNFPCARIKGNKTHCAPPLEYSETAAVFAFFVASINTAAANKRNRQQFQMI
jgi:hypothetical protein